MEAFQQDKYFAKMKFWRLWGNVIRVFDASNTKLLLYVKQKAFKLKEEITIFADETQNTPVLKIKARSIIDFGATYDVADAVTGEKIGALRRKGLKSILKDSWLILDASDNEIGKVEEGSVIMAMLSRTINFIPQHYQITMGDKLVGKIDQTWNIFMPQMRIDFSMDTAKVLDRRLGIATVVLLQVIEGKQQ
ncbi:MAG TPA: hypothetical protein PLY93_02560 [Turneriella sp.]|nr:hypothetical protein [Turneriella sp.]